MKGLAFALDPNGYWIEVIKRTEGHTLQTPYNLSQTMLRIKDPARSLAFYRDTLGLTLVRERFFEEAKFSLYFLQHISEEEKKTLPDPKSQEANEALMKRFQPVIELTHNHGTENDEQFSYHNGWDEPAGFRNLRMDTVDCQALQKQLSNTGIKVLTEASSPKGPLWVADPDGYRVEFLAGDEELASTSPVWE